MDSSESLFRETSKRRATAWPARSVVGWSLAALAFLAIVVAVLELIDV
jgi:hypothetical protein